MYCYPEIMAAAVMWYKIKGRFKNYTEDRGRKWSIGIRLLNRRGEKYAGGEDIFSKGILVDKKIIVSYYCQLLTAEAHCFNCLFDVICEVFESIENSCIA